MACICEEKKEDKSGDLWYKDVGTNIEPKKAFIGGFEAVLHREELGRWVKMAN